MLDQLARLESKEMLEQLERLDLLELMEQRVQQVQLGQEPRAQLDLQVLLGHLVGQQAQRELQAREPLEQLGYLVSTEPQEQQACVDRLEPLALQDCRVLLDYKVPLE